MNVENLIRKYLGEQHMMQVATVDSSQPWICTVYYVIDEALNLYWASKPSRRHSLEIIKHRKVAATVAVRHEKGEKVVGIQLEGEAVMVESPGEIKPIALKYAEKFRRDEQWVKDFTNLETDHRLYKLTPRLFVLFDEQNFPHDTRHEWLPAPRK